MTCRLFGGYTSFATSYFTSAIEEAWPRQEVCSETKYTPSWLYSVMDVCHTSSSFSKNNVRSVVATTRRPKEWEAVPADDGYKKSFD